MFGIGEFVQITGLTFKTLRCTRVTGALIPARVAGACVALL